MTLQFSKITGTRLACRENLLRTVNQRPTRSYTALSASESTALSRVERTTRTRSAQWSHRRDACGGYDDTRFWTVASMSAMAMASAAALSWFNNQEHLDRVVACEGETHRANEATNLSENVNVQEEEEGDPYENLPDEDEPTDCSMCNTFRQGPCRNPWRKLERCFKDHEKEEGGATKCMRYFLPHQECLMKFTNLYLLVGHEMKQDLVTDIEAAFAPNEREKIPMPKIDWSLYMEFLNEQGPNFSQTIQNTTTSDKGDDATTPLWQRFPPNMEPLLIMVPTELPNIDETTGWVLKVAYVVDQNGKVLGFHYSETYSALLKKSQGQDEGGKNDSEAEVQKNDESVSLRQEPVKIKFVIVPGETKQICIKAYYSENPVHAPPDKEILDARLLEGPLQFIPGTNSV